MNDNPDQWFNQYIQQVPPVEDTQDGPTSSGGRPFTRKGDLFVSPDHLARGMREQGRVTTGPNEARQIIEAQGGTPSGRAVRITWPGISHATYRFWRTPQAQPQNSETEAHHG